MGQYNTLGAGGTGVLQQDMLNPMQQSGFQQNLQMGNQNAFNLSNRNNQNIQNRAGMFGGATTPGFLQNQMTQSGNQLASNQSSIFNQNLLYSDQLRQSAATQSLGYRPLQTGGTQQGTQTQSTGGVGAWATPIISAGLGVATGGMSTLMGGAASAFGGASGLTPQMFQGGGMPSGMGDQSTIQPSMFNQSQGLTDMSSYNPWLDPSSLGGGGG